MADTVAYTDVTHLLAQAPASVSSHLLAVRKLIFSVAAACDVEIEETTKWGQAAYLPCKSGVGTTLRLDQRGGTHLCLYVHCQTDLVSRLSALFPNWTYVGKRAIEFDVRQALPKDDLRVAIELVLTYHRVKRNEQRKAR